MICKVVAMLRQVHISPLGSLPQVCLVQDTYQMANFMYTQLRTNPLMLVIKSKQTSFNTMFKL